VKGVEPAFSEHPHIAMEHQQQGKYPMRPMKTSGVIIIALLLAACAQAVVKVAPTFPSPLSPLSPLSAPLPSEKKENMPPDAVIVYQRSGGLAGRTEGWSIYTNGLVMSSDGKSGQVSPEEVADLLRQADAAGFFSWRDSYLPKNTCCDRFTYKLTVRMAGQTKTVTTIDAASEEPAELGTILDQVSRLVTKAIGQ
jgi:hypothetical protein